MGRKLVTLAAVFAVSPVGLAQTENALQLGGTTPLLAAGAEAIRAGLYDKGIELTLKGLAAENPGPRDRAAGLSNLCAAHAAREEPDRAIDYCTEALDFNSVSWRAYSNRSYAYWLKGMYFEAVLDLDSAALIAPNAPQVRQIRGMINEASLSPSVRIEDHQ